MKDNSNQQDVKKAEPNATPSGERERKIGAGHFKAYWRQGFKELSSLLPAFPDSVRVVEEPGLYGNPTNYDVSKQTGAVKEKSKGKGDSNSPQPDEKSNLKDAQPEIQLVNTSMAAAPVTEVNSKDSHEIPEPEMD